MGHDLQLDQIKWIRLELFGLGYYITFHGLMHPNEQGHNLSRFVVIWLFLLRNRDGLLIQFIEIIKKYKHKFLKD